MDCCKLFFAAFSWAPPVVGLAVLAALVGVAMLWVFGKTSNQARMKQVKRKVYASLLELRVFADEPARHLARAEIPVRRQPALHGLGAKPAVWLAFQ